MFSRKSRSAMPSPLDGIDVVLADLDGVIYRGADAIPHAVDSLNLAGTGARIGYLTNNASRTDRAVAEQLTGFGLGTGDGGVAAEDIITSPQAAVRLLAGLVPSGSLVFVVGGDGLVDELGKAGFAVTRSADDGPAALVQGFAQDIAWPALAEASYALNAPGEIPWVATNMDWTLPTVRGIAPGNGTLVSAVHLAVGRLPVVAGKPEVAIFEEARERFDARHPLFIGDRLDTDILGANRAGMAAAMVLTGVDHAKQLIAADAAMRPRYILTDLRQLHEPYPETRFSRDGATATVRDAAVRIAGDTVQIVTDGAEIDLLRAACAAIWRSDRPLYSLDVPAGLYA